MPNMSYCRFNNTLNDLRDCENALEEEEAMSRVERSKALFLIDVCKRISKNYEGDSDEEILNSFKKDEDEDE